MLVVDSQIQIPLADMRYSFSRSSGPGGQNVNKVNSKVTLHWNIESSPHLPVAVRERFKAKYGHRINADGDVVIYSQRNRDQIRNREDCLEKLRQLILSVRTPPKRRRPTRPTPGSVRRRLAAKKNRGTVKSLRGKIEDQD